MRISQSCAECLYERQKNKTNNAEYLAEIKQLLDNRIVHTVEELMKHIHLLLAQRILKGYAELVELVRELGRVDFALTVDL